MQLIQLLVPNQHGGFVLSIGAIEKTGALYGEGTGLILLSNLRCRGLENSLLECVNSGILQNINCGHNQDAGVTCVAGTMPLNLHVSQNRDKV